MATGDSSVDRLTETVGALSLDGPLVVMTINLGCGSGEEWATAAERRAAAEFFIKSEEPHVVFAQEKFAPSKPQWDMKGLDQYQSTKSTGPDVPGFLWDTHRLENSKEITNDKKNKISALLSKQQYSAEDVSEFASRSRAVVFKDKQNGQLLLLISWHGPHKSTSFDEKKKTFNALQKFVLLLRDNEPDRPEIIIGGDFNLSKDDAKENLDPEFKLADYKPGRKKAIDFFMYTSGLRLNNTRPIIPRKKRALDHDPIVSEVSPCRKK